jgi:hypothetical protein
MSSMKTTTNVGTCSPGQVDPTREWKECKQGLVWDGNCSVNPAAFVREVEDGVVRIVGRYAPRTESLWSWDIRGSNVRLNWVFELNRLPYGGYPGDDVATAADRRRKKPVTVDEEGPSREATLATKKRKIGTAVGVGGL